MKLTEQQQAVVDHNEGPALVFAVAGAGKTTAMVHRIGRLVAEAVFAPQQILATSFGRANVRDLRQDLARWPGCHGVDARTLHSLGRQIILEAQRAGAYRRLKLNGNGRSPDTNVSQNLLSQTLAEARRRNAPYKRELDGIDRADFLDYVGFCKGNLLYPDLKRARLPDRASGVAGQAPPPAEPLGWYLDLYLLFEEVRQQRGLITFDDMLLTGWEALVSLPQVQAAFQERYRCLVVDEFQDINLAQSEMLHLLAAPHGNYMAVGDDDQTIYEWRGARPHFILNFAERYAARAYLISENFRCTAVPLTLANGVIRHNKKREPKRLSLTRGLAGEAEVIASRDVAHMSRRIVHHLARLHETGIAWGEMAVLVRLNAQTPPIEQALIAQKIPYRVSQPFYERQEIKTLIQYGRLAWLEKALQEGKRPLLSPSAREKLGEGWRGICNRPKRYVSSRLREQMLQDFIRSEEPLSHVVTQYCYRVQEDWLAERLEALADDIAWLAYSLQKPAHEALRLLVARLDYVTFVRESSGFPQTGEGRAASVESFLDYARDRGSLFDFLRHVAELAAAGSGQNADPGEDVVTLSTMHQAKGLEWPVVFVAQCNEKIMPFNATRTADVEEERRLFYVALTRSRRDLYLYLTQTERPSPFLSEANWREVIPALQSLRNILAKDPSTWRARDALLLARTVPELRLERYFRLWWDVGEERRMLVAERMLHFFDAVGARRWHGMLGLEPEWCDWWRELGSGTAVVPDGDFPGLDKLRPRRRRRK